ncbi:MFS transporter [Desulfurispora thermophila]|uniref:MFS transporter n=1 Tax=Desulfurispora thermophila TaxID=265470 RepID=UPI00036D2971|nr:MFS transporter [Desulfurispora thermophila]
MPTTRLTLAWLSLTLFMEALVYGLITPLAPYYARELNLSAGQLGSFFAVYSLALFAASFPAGSACDRLGHRPVLAAGMLLLAASTLLFALVHNLWWLVLARVLQGAAGAAIWTAALAAATALLPRQQRGSGLGWMMAVTGLGTIAGPVFSGVAFHSLGYAAPFFSTAGLVLVLALPAFGRSLSETNREAQEQSGYGNLADMKILMIILLVAASSFSLGMLEPLLPLHLTNRFHQNSRDIGLMFGYMSLVYFGTRPFWGHLGDKKGYLPLILPGLLVTAISLPALALAPDLVSLYAAAGVFSAACCAMTTPCLPLLAEYSDRKGEESYGRSYALVNAAYSVGLLLGPAAGGWLTDCFSFSGALLAFSLLLLLLGAGFYKYTARTRQTPSPTRPGK